MKKIYIDEQEVDVYPGDIPVGLDFQIADIRTLNVRKNSKSTTIRLPATAKNKKTFGFPEDWNSASAVDQKQKPRVLIEKDGTPLMRGFAKVDAAVTNGQISEYRLKVLGDNGDWVKRIEGKKLSDLDYSSDNHTLNENAVINSWTLSPSRNYVYDLIDRGKFTAFTGNGFYVNLSDCYPAISFSSFMQKIFAGTGYKIVSGFLSSQEFKGLYWPFVNPVFKHNDTWAPLQKFKASQFKSGGQNIIKGATQQSASTGGTGLPLNMNNYVNANPLYDYFLTGLSNPTQFRVYSVPSSGKYKFHLRVNFATSGNATDINGGGGTIYFNIRKIKRTTFGGPNYYSSTSTLVHQHSEPWAIMSKTTDVIFEADLEYGDLIYTTADISFSANTASACVLTIFNDLSGNNCFFELTDLKGPFKIQYGQPVDMNVNLPENISQIDFIQALKDAFNLYFMTDVETRTVYIEPEDSFYGTKAVDWSKKLDKFKEIITEFIGDTYPKHIRYKLAADSKDAPVKQISETNGVDFGSHQATIANQFAKDETKDFANKLFAPTLMAIPPAPLIGLKSIKIPRMWSDLSQPYPQKTDYKPRMLYYDGLRPVGASSNTWYLVGWNKNVNASGSGVNGITPFKPQTTYPRFYSYGDTPGDFNYLFEDMPNAHGLWQRHYRNKHKKIDDSRIITAWFYLTEADISKLDFRTPIYCELEENGGAYLTLESVDGYDPDVKEPTKVRLIKAVGTKALIALSAIPKPSVNLSQIINTASLQVKGGGGGNQNLKVQNQTVLSVSAKTGVITSGGGNTVFAKVNGNNVPVVMTTSDNKLAAVVVSDGANSEEEAQQSAAGGIGAMQVEGDFVVS